MIKVLFRISKKIDSSYLESIEAVLNSINDEFEGKKIAFECSSYDFKNSEKKDIENEPDSFLNSKYIDKLDDQKVKKYNSIIYIPDSSTNLKGNYLWYSIGGPQDQLMVISSFIFKNLIDNRLNFGAYSLLIYSQFLARYTVDLDEPHDESRDCLNDYCAEQLEILNVFKNNKHVLCNECFSEITNKGYYYVIKRIIGFIRKRYYKKTGGKALKARVHVVEPEQKSKVKFKFNKGRAYEFEIFMAKKCINLSTLYLKLDELLKNPDSEIEGYSLYEVDGGWRAKIDLLDAELNDWETLKLLRERLGNGDFKNLIKPLFEDKKENKFAVFDERSIVLKIIITSESKIKPWDKKSNKVIREIINIFEEITENEKSIFFTLKKLDRTGNIKRN